MHYLVWHVVIMCCGKEVVYENEVQQLHLEQTFGGLKLSEPSYAIMTKYF